MYIVYYCVTLELNDHIYFLYGIHIVRPLLLHFSCNTYATWCTYHIFKYAYRAETSMKHMKGSRQ